ncbi:DDE-type integrase/transposase/recombinase [Clostridium sp. UBA4395]|uniref:DDE-type integrase/transposase/recombinase n=1 Tax=Clostridium sp. UBA4395 TaxID=1946360 RepID=UPI003216D4FD
MLNQDFSAENTSEKWAGDITYIHAIKDGWCYLAAVLDLCSKKVIGHSFGRTMDADLVIEALNNAYVNQHPKKGEK